MDGTDDLVAGARELIEVLTVRREGDRWVGQTPPWFGERLFGGFILGQAVHAVTRLAPAGTRIHSLHAYFLGPVFAGPPVAYDVEALKTGRSFTVHRVDAAQEGRPVVTMVASFTADVDGYVYELPPDSEPPGRDTIEPDPGHGPWELRLVGPTAPRTDGTRASTHREWVRLPLALPDDPHLHAALVAYVTDMTTTGARRSRSKGISRASSASTMPCGSTDFTFEPTAGCSTTCTRS